jgi:hypothetical protein
MEAALGLVVAGADDRYAGGIEKEIHGCNALARCWDGINCSCA